MKFSLVVTTLNRSVEIKKLLNSLISQQYKNFEVIIVDQSYDNKTSDVIDHFKNDLDINYIKAKVRGASRGKNIGIKNSTGDIIGFPDDDCWYSSDILLRIKNYFTANKVDLISVPVVDPDKNNIVITKFLPESCKINLKNVWHAGVVAGIFCTSNYAKEIMYDEDLGVGSGTIYESGEETDFLIRGVNHGYDLMFLNDIFIYHPLKDINIGSSVVSRYFRYGAGLGKVLKKNKFPIAIVAKNIIRPILGTIIYFLGFNFLKSKACAAGALGRIRGYFF